MSADESVPYPRSSVQSAYSVSHSKSVSESAFAEQVTADSEWKHVLVMLQCLHSRDRDALE
jgi:hypothetical protein